ncbi:MAG: hypothetical protein IK086_03605 [Clostridia bacterium]|nr:hypothetical protein [Clostridia bacterium]
MYSLNTAAKKTAKAALKNNYTGGVVAASVFVFMYFACSILCSLIGMFAGEIFLLAAMCLFAVFIMIPLFLGFVYWSVKLIFASDNEPVLIFKYFTSIKNYKRALAFSLPFTGIALFSGVVLFIPYFIVEALASGKLFAFLNMQIPIWAPGLSVVANGLEAAALFLLAFIMLKYYLAPFLMAADENMEASEALHMSRVISRRSKGEFFLLLLGLIGYIIACLFVLPTVFILPYLFTAYAVHCRFTVTAYNISIDNIKRPDIPSFNADISF